MPRAATGIDGLDQITGGGLPLGRPTLVCGGPGCGKTLLAMEFLVRGALQFDAPGVFMSFEETAEELSQNVRSLGFDLDKLVAAGRIVLDHVHVDHGDVEETGEYDLEGLFIRLGAAIDAIGAQRVVLDTLETLFAGLSDRRLLRSELRRLFRWLKDRQVTCIVTAERGDGPLTRHGLEEYVSDCVIFLDHRVTEQTSIRRLRVVKYRGAMHGTNEYPFLIDESGLSVLPITSVGLDHPASDRRISTGIPRLDSMLGGNGYYRGSSILISGTAGTGKTSFAAAFAGAACARGERCLYLAFEESRAQVVRNMRSVGLDLEPWLREGRLVFHASRPTLYGLEMHLLTIYKLVQQYRPTVIIIYPISNLASDPRDAHAMLLRLVDFLKSHQITALMASLTSGGRAPERTDVQISSLIDTWLLLRNVESGGERNRLLYVLKSRGMSHSNQVRGYVITDRGIEVLDDIETGPEGVLAGTGRGGQQLRGRAQEDLAAETAAPRARRQGGDQDAPAYDPANLGGDKEG